jgi:hypothetical protein
MNDYAFVAGLIAFAGLSMLTVRELSRWGK